MSRAGIVAVLAAVTLHGCGAVAAVGLKTPTPEVRRSVEDARAAAIARAQVWTPTDVAAADIRTGPAGPGAFPFRETVVCEFVPKELGGLSPKFACVAGQDDELKVKYGGTNAEVYGEVAATRLLWALGFGADRVYSVGVVCRGCPPELGGIAREGNQWVFDPAAVERKMAGREFPGGEAWSWEELDTIDEDAGGATRAQRDALKLLAVFIQHTDSKPDQQRLVCLDKALSKADPPVCERPFMLVQDVGLTFGRANRLNDNARAMSLVDWSATPVWKAGEACVGNLPRSMTGTLHDPVISEEGRRFLAELLTQLSDAQIRDLFEVARVNLRVREPVKARSGLATVDEWVQIFKQKRAEIVDRRCA
jgi:hypothetical protein